MNDNHVIKCDVRKCQHNREGKDCELGTIKITCSEKGCTCCGDFDENK